MSTRSRITVKKKNAEYRSVYCHSDGYPEGVGETLTKWYSSQERAEALVALGDLSSLDKSIECPEDHSFDSRKPGYTVAYFRDRGEGHAGGNCAMSYAKAVGHDGWEEYFYFWDGKQWLVNEDRSTVPAMTVADKIAEDGADNEDED